MTLTNDEQTALDYLDSVTENTYADPAYITEFPETIGHVATIAAAVARLANEADNAADNAAAVVSNGLVVTSATSTTIAASGTKTFSISSDLNDAPFAVGMWAKAYRTSDPAQWMFGYVSAVEFEGSPDTLELTVQQSNGSGTYSDWTIAATGGPGASGANVMTFVSIDYGSDITDGDGKSYLIVPSQFNGMNLSRVHGRVITAGTSSGSPTEYLTMQIHNVTYGVDMLSTPLRIDSGETDSADSAVPVVIDTSNDNVATNDLLRLDIDEVMATAPRGLIVTLEFELP